MIPREMLLLCARIRAEKEKKWSGRRDSNSRHQPWQGCTLPAELLPLETGTSIFTDRKRSVKPEPTIAMIQHRLLRALNGALPGCTTQKVAEIPGARKTGKSRIVGVRRKRQGRRLEARPPEALKNRRNASAARRRARRYNRVSVTFRSRARSPEMPKRSVLSLVAPRLATACRE